jgi:peptidoglycan/LPS O-acetylase OafA/YrhL
MMLLGLVIHSSISFATKPLGRAWPYQDVNTSVIFDVTVFFIHVFRMPLFFLMAGFFAAYLYYRRGPWAMLQNRALRVVVPFVLFLPLLFPATRSGFLFSRTGGVNGGLEAALAYLANPLGWYDGFRTIHLWFLYYLILFYAAILLVMPVVQRLTRSWAESAVPWLGRLIHHPIGFALGTAVTFVTLLPMRYAGLDTEAGFLVEPKILLAYGVFVGFGWVLYLNREQVDGFARRAWLYMIVGVLLSGGYLAYIVGVSPGYMLFGKAIAALAMWALIYGFLGLFVRYYDHPRPMGRYLSDASYWLYLVHLPITIWMPGLMNGWDVSALLKSGLTLVVTTIISLLTYHYLVRSTAIGVLLSGKRYPRALPRFDEQGNYVRPQPALAR